MSVTAVVDVVSHTNHVHEKKLHLTRYLDVFLQCMPRELRSLIIAYEIAQNPYGTLAKHRVTRDMDSIGIYRLDQHFYFNGQAPPFAHPKVLFHGIYAEERENERTVVPQDVGVHSFGTSLLDPSGRYLYLWCHRKEDDSFQMVVLNARTFKLATNDRFFYVSNPWNPYTRVMIAASHNAIAFCIQRTDRFAVTIKDASTFQTLSSTVFRIPLWLCQMPVLVLDQNAFALVSFGEVVHFQFRDQ